MSVEIRLLEDNEFELVNNFFNSIYKSNRSLENFKWEFVNGPNGKAIYVLAVDKSKDYPKIVGIQCAIPIEFISSSGKIVLTAKSEDTLVDPDYRGQKIFERMYALLFEECVKAGIKYIWGFTPASKAFERIGFTVPFKAHQGLLVNEPIAAYQHLSGLNKLNTFKEKIKIAGLSFMSFIKRWIKQPDKNQIEFKDLSNESLQRYFIEFKSGKLYHHINQTKEYIHWRQFSNPYQNQYKNISFANSKAQVTINFRKGIGYIEQMIFASDISESNREKIVGDACHLLLKQGVSAIRTLCFDTNDELRSQTDLYAKNGFIILKRGNWFVWKSLDNQNEIKPESILLNRFYLQGNM